METMTGTTPELEPFVRRRLEGQAHARNPEVVVAPSAFKGAPEGPVIRARVRPLEGAEAADASELIQAKHPILQAILVPLGHRLKRVRTLHFEPTPVDAEPAFSPRGSRTARGGRPPSRRRRVTPRRA